MSQFTVLATPRSFAEKNRSPIEMLESANCTVIRLPLNGERLEDQLWDCLPQADAVIAGLEPYPRSLLERGTKLKIISRYGVGYDNIDLNAATELGIRITNTPGANTDSVADLAMALMLCTARHICYMNNAILHGHGGNPIAGTEMWNKTLGVIGTGRIGKAVIRRASGFQMRILAYDTYQDERIVKDLGGTYTDLETLFSSSDFISLHCPLTAETTNLVNALRLSKMKSTAIIVNTARGGIIDESALYDALKNGTIAGAALDATKQEPIHNSPLTMLPNCILTPHAGAATEEATNNMGLMAVKNALDILQGKPCQYVVN